MAWRMPWPLQRRSGEPTPAPSMRGPAPIPDRPDAAGDAVAPRSPSGDWASLPALRPSVGAAPLTAPSAEFAHEQVTNVAIQMALQSLGHDHSASGPAGLVSGAALPVVSRSVAESVASATPGPGSDRPGALDRFAHRVLGSIGSRGHERRGVETGAGESAAVADAATLADGGGDRLQGGVEAPAGAAPAPDLPPPFVRVVPAVQRDVLGGAAPLVHAADVAVGPRVDGIVSRAKEGTGAHHRRAGAERAEGSESDPRPDAEPGLRAPGVPAFESGPEWAIQRAASDAGRSGQAPARLSVGQVRRLGLGAPLGGPKPASAAGRGRFGAPGEDATAASAGAALTAPPPLPMPRLQRGPAGAGSRPADDRLAAGADAAVPSTRQTAAGGQIEAGAVAGVGFAPGSHPAADDLAAAAPDPGASPPAVVGVLLSSPAPMRREAGDLRPLVGRRHLGRVTSGPTTGISVSRLVDPDPSPPGGTADRLPMAGDGFDTDASGVIGRVPGAAGWAHPDGAPTFPAAPDIPSWAGPPGAPDGSARRSTSTAPGAPSVFRTSSAGPAPGTARAALQREWSGAGPELPFQAAHGPATSIAAPSIQRDPDPSQGAHPTSSEAQGSFDADVVQRAIGGSAGGAGAGSLPTGDRELELLAESLYERVRSHLRLELLVDRERAGIQSNLS